MSLTIRVEDYTDESMKLFDPIEAYGAPNGTIYRMYCHGKPSDTFFIGVGVNERPICVWWDDEGGNFRLSSDSKKDLKDFLPHVKIRKCGPLSMVRVEMVIEDYDDGNAR